MPVAQRPTGTGTNSQTRVDLCLRMRLLSANMLVCIVKGCVDNYPLQIVPTKVEQEETDSNVDFVLNMLPRISYSALRQMAIEVGVNSLPEQLPANITKENNMELLELLHSVLTDVHVQEGALVCRKCGRQYNIRQGIPNMLLLENEV